MIPTIQAVTRFSRALIPLLAISVFSVQQIRAADAFVPGSVDTNFLAGGYGAITPNVNVIEMDTNTGSM
jgi:hypothetical protein